VQSNGAWKNTFSENVREWRLIEHHDQPALDLALHGIHCGRDGAQTCRKTLIYRDGRWHQASLHRRDAAETGSARVPAGASAELPSPAAIRSKAADYLVREQIAEACDGKEGKIDPGAVIERDLTGDGKADLIISHEGITCGNRERGGSCGAQVCSVMIYVRRGALLVLAREMLGTGVTVGDGAIHMHAHGGKRGTVKWNGREFR
jgi:hypothetical protein